MDGVSVSSLVHAFVICLYLYTKIKCLIIYYDVPRPQVLDWRTKRQLISWKRRWRMTLHLHMRRLFR